MSEEEEEEKEKREENQCKIKHKAKSSQTFSPALLQQLRKVPSFFSEIYLTCFQMGQVT